MCSCVPPQEVSFPPPSSLSPCLPVTQPAREILTDSRLRLTSLALASPLSTETNRAFHYLLRIKIIHFNITSSDNLSSSSSFQYHQNNLQSSFIYKLALKQAYLQSTFVNRPISVIPNLEDKQWLFSPLRETNLSNAKQSCCFVLQVGN